MKASCQFALIGLLFAPPLAWADAFDDYTNAVLVKAVKKADGVEPVKTLTPEQMVRHGQVLKGVAGAVIFVKTNENRLARLLVQPARQKISDTESLPILLVDRFVTYREGEEKTIFAQGQNVRLFADFRFSLDIGQVVPAALQGDLKFVVEKDGFHVEPVGKAEMYLLTQPLAEATPKKSTKLVVGPKFLPSYFTGTYKLHDDGRRSGTLHLKVEENGDVNGAYYSDKDGQKYEVDGKIGMTPYAIAFKVTFPRTAQFFQGMMFTGDGSAIVGTSRMQDRETGFYATRLDARD